MFQFSFSFFFFLQYAFIVLAQRASQVPPSDFPTTGLSTTGSVSTTVTSSTGSSSVTTASTTVSGYPSLSTYSACVSDCLQVGVARVNCTSLTDVNCYCMKPSFAPELVGCLQSNCPTEAGSAENLAQQFCNLSSSTPSLSFPPLPSTTTSPTPTAPSSTTTSTSPSPTTSSAASRNVGAVPQSVMLGLVISILCFAVGAYAVQ